MSLPDQNDVLGQTDGGNTHRHTKHNKRGAPKNRIIAGKIYADWCSGCQALKPEWKKMRGILSKQHRDVKYLEIESAKVNQILPKIKQKYGVDISYSVYPTIFIIKNGQVKYYNGDPRANKMAKWYMNEGEHTTASQHPVLGLFGGEPRKTRHTRKIQKSDAKPTNGFLGFFFGKE
ncbi:hypothetical protein EB093_08795 [bacterium]|nr:hypothetical protein [bacterium]